MQRRNLAPYSAELRGTMLLVLLVGAVVTLHVGPVAGSLVALAVFKWVLEADSPAPTEPPERVKAAGA